MIDSSQCTVSDIGRRRRPACNNGDQKLPGSPACAHTSLSYLGLTGMQDASTAPHPRRKVGDTTRLQGRYDSQMLVWCGAAPPIPLCCSIYIYYILSKPGRRLPYPIYVGDTLCAAVPAGPLVLSTQGPRHAGHLRLVRSLFLRPTHGMGRGKRRAPHGHGSGDRLACLPCRQTIALSVLTGGKE